jgi:hypothetical protein
MCSSVVFAYIVGIIINDHHLLLVMYVAVAVAIAIAVSVAVAVAVAIAVSVAVAVGASMIWVFGVLVLRCYRYNTL